MTATAFRVLTALATLATVATLALAGPAAAAVNLPPEVLALHQRAIDDGICDRNLDLLFANFPTVIARVSPADTLYVVPCAFGIINQPSVAYVVTTGAHAGTRALMFAQYDQDFGWIADTLQFNAKFDPATGTLTSRELYGPGGDCGTEGTWVWRDYAFALTRYRFQAPCDRSHKLGDWTVIYEAPAGGGAPRPQIGDIPNFFQTSP